ncbi:MAG TPA: hypothetical protein VGM73_17705 [Candidatus Didemnitutus sp.]
MREACLPVGSPRRAAIRSVLAYLEPVASFFPGRIGRWLRAASFFANISRHLGWIRL